MADLVTYSEVQARAMEADATIDSQQTEVEGVISDISARIESHLYRELLSHEITQRIYRAQWMREPIEDAFVVWASAWPVVSVSTDGFSRLDDRKIKGRRDDVAITYTAGYKRVGEGGTEPELPNDIRNVCLRLVLFEVSETADDMLGLGQREQAIGNGNQLTVRGRDRDFQQRELAKLDHYKRRIAL